MQQLYEIYYIDHVDFNLITLHTNLIYVTYLCCSNVNCYFKSYDVTTSTENNVLYKFQPNFNIKLPVGKT